MGTGLRHRGTARRLIRQLNRYATLCGFRLSYGLTGVCTPIRIDNGIDICEHSPLDHLLLVLAAVVLGQLTIADSHVFAVKAWLINRAAELEPGDYFEIGIKNKADPEQVDLLARVGKDEQGQVVFWHVGLPWPATWAA